jgi:hypothetical protein
LAGVKRLGTGYFQCIPKLSIGDSSLGLLRIEAAFSFRNKNSPSSISGVRIPTFQVTKKRALQFAEPVCLDVNQAPHLYNFVLELAKKTRQRIVAAVFSEFKSPGWLFLPTRKEASETINDTIGSKGIIWILTQSQEITVNQTFVLKMIHPRT